jgi:hypothetical protein
LKEFELRFQHTKKMHRIYWDIDSRENPRFGEADANIALAGLASRSRNSHPVREGCAKSRRRK